MGKLYFGMKAQNRANTILWNDATGNLAKTRLETRVLEGQQLSDKYDLSGEISGHKNSIALNGNQCISIFMNN